LHGTDEGCNTASIPIVISKGQKIRLPEKMPKSVSELNYESLPITGDSWFKYHGSTDVMALGGQVRESVNDEYY